MRIEKNKYYESKLIDGAHICVRSDMSETNPFCICQLSLVIKDDDKMRTVTKYMTLSLKELRAYLGARKNEKIEIIGAEKDDQN